MTLCRIAFGNSEKHLRMISYQYFYTCITLGTISSPNTGFVKKLYLALSRIKPLIKLCQTSTYWQPDSNLMQVNAGASELCEPLDQVPVCS